MIEARLSTSKIKKIYNFASRFYFLLSRIERKPLARGIELAQIKPDEKVLEVAVGPGLMFLEILKRVDQNNVVHGIDLSPRMLDKTKKSATKNGFSNFDLREGDARRLPFPDETFDVLYNGYMFDLVPLADLRVILEEFYRVLKKGGRIVLVNFSKENNSPIFTETLYRFVPSLWLGCRPVLMETFVEQAGFGDVKREFPKFSLSLPSEIVTGLRK